MPKSSFTPTQITSIISDYNSGKSPSNIATSFGKHCNTIHRILRDNGIDANQRQKITTEMEQVVVSEYKQNFSSVKIAKRNNLDSATVLRVLKKHKIPIKSVGAQKRTYTIEENYFQGIDTEMKAYLLGLIHSARSVSTRNSGIQINHSDKEILQTISNIVYGFNNVKNSSLKFFSKQICKDLISHKILKHDIIKLSSNELQNHYLRGLYECGKDIGLAYNDLLSLYLGATIFSKAIYQKLSSAQNTNIQQSTISNNPSNYGTNLLATYKGNKLSVANIKTLSDEQKIEASEEVFQFYRQSGFPYPKYSNNELIKDFTSLKNFDISAFINSKVIKIHNQSGNDIFKHFNPHFWETKSAGSNKPSMLEAFDDDKYLKKVIQNRLEQNYNITGSMIRQGLNTSKIAYRASIFAPIIAKTIYQAYCKNGDIVYDYSMGFGQRLLAALSMPFDLSYVGVDPYEKSYQSNKDIDSYIRGNIPIIGKKTEIKCIGSEDYCPENMIGKVKLAFSSPPYFNLEIYDNGSEKQAYAGNDYIRFLGWWKKVVENVDKMLMSDGIFAINSKEMVGKFDILKDMLCILGEKGFVEIERYNIQTNKNTKFNNKTGKDKFEPIVILKKKK